MKLKFHIKYATAWGERLCVVMACHANDGQVRYHHDIMQTDDGEIWTLETSLLESRQHPLSHIVYAYQVEDGDSRVLRREWSMVARCYHYDPTKDYLFLDQWRDRPLPFHLYTDACMVTRHGKLGEVVEPRPLPLYRRTLMFRVSAPQLEYGQAVAICGSHPSMGCWNPSRYLRMEYVGQHEWMLTVNAMGILLPLEYKYVVVDDHSHALLKWEEGSNRMVEGTEVADGEVRVVYGEQLRLAEKTWRTAGVAIPVAALRSEHSYGVGDFGDLRRMVAWAERTGMGIVQLLPVNDTTTSHHADDACPYNIISGFALHPHYVDLEAAGTLRSKSMMMQFRRRQQELNALATYDYEAVDRVKSEYLQQLFAEQGKKLLSTPEATAFIAACRAWLTPYARYRKEAFDYVCFVQYLLHSQLKQAADDARRRGIVIMGDMPIGMRRDSVDVEQHPALFHLDTQMGVAPDSAANGGQCWGFPPYRWEHGNRELATWLQQRLNHMQTYFGAIRLDHVLGYFRTWQIPLDGMNGVLGHYEPALPLTIDEIEYFGLHFRKELFTKPFINDSIIERTFGLHANYVKEQYLQRKAYQLYELKEEYDSQQKIQKAFEGRNDENSIWIRDGLMQLVADVLFVIDGNQAEMYHPRIFAMEEPIYEALSSEEKEAFARLYNNYFRQRHSLFWEQQAMHHLSDMLDNCRMLVCGEDLGPQPDCVQTVLDAMRILSTEAQRFPKQRNMEFAHLDANPYRSLATIATHDMQPLRLWWQANAECRQRYYITMMQKEGRAPEQLPAHLAEEIIARHLYCPSMMCILLWQDWMAMDGELRWHRPQDERINVPADPTHHWDYRMHITIEQLLQADRFNDKVKTMIARSHRASETNKPQQNTTHNNKQ